MSLPQFLYLEQQQPPICININRIYAIVKDTEKDIFYITYEASRNIIVNKDFAPIDYAKINKFVLNAL